MRDDVPPDLPGEVEDPDTGEPVTELDGLDLQPRPGFLPRLRRRIERRNLSSQMLVVSWEWPRLVLLELLNLLFGPEGPSKGDPK